MGFSCEIKQGDKSLTSDDTINYKLLGLAPNTAEVTDAPNRLSELRSVVSECAYGHKLPEAAQDCFARLQYMVRENIESLIQHHCHTCTCEATKPRGWDVEAIERFLSIDVNSITYISGGY
jgi:hypothetical protein